MKHEDLLKTAMAVAIEQYKALESPEYTSLAAARKQYGSTLVREWEQAGVLKPIPTNSGKSYRFLTSQLKALWVMYVSESRGLLSGY